MEEKPFLDHLEDVRNTIIRILITFCIATGTSFFFIKKIFWLLCQPLHKAVPSVDYTFLYALAPADALTMSLKITLVCGLVFSLPCIIYFIASFILPALTLQEKKVILLLFSVGALLFISGMLFCYFCLLPVMIHFLWKYTESLGIANKWTIQGYISLCLNLLIACGIIFELPPIILGLVKLNIIDYEQLKRSRRHAIVCAFIIAAVLTPPDVVSQILLALPLIGLFECSVLGAYLIKKHQK